MPGLFFVEGTPHRQPAFNTMERVFLAIIVAGVLLIMASLSLLVPMTVNSESTIVSVSPPPGLAGDKPRPRPIDDGRTTGASPARNQKNR
jgi:hypothetical protein